MREPIDWDEADLQRLIREQITESLTLEYKSSGALAKTDPKKAELSKDVSAFANSAGGTIVYGIAEDGRSPNMTDEGIDPAEISKEWMEQVINSTIYPKIEGLRINQISLGSRDAGLCRMYPAGNQSRSAPSQGQKILQATRIRSRPYGGL